MEPGEEGRVQGALRVRRHRQGAEALTPFSIKGFQGTSLLDFPGRVASLLFTGGCNLSCPYCHNPGLVLDPGAFPDLPLDDLLADLYRRRAFIDGIVVSGGEPTLDPGLPTFLRQVREFGLQVKLDSNGLLPEVLDALLEEGLLDYLAIDLKTASRRYAELHRLPVDISRLQRTVELAKTAAIEVEFRTTCVPQLVAAQDVRAIGELLRGARLWVLQQFVPQHAMFPEWREQPAYSREQLDELARLAETYVERVLLRGV